jgi:ankyrin repeat protein
MKILELIIRILKKCLGLEEQTPEKHLANDDLTLLFSALSKEDRKFVKDCNPKGRESKTYNFLSDKLSKYLVGQRSESDAPPKKSNHLDEEEKYSDDNVDDDTDDRDIDSPLRAEDLNWKKQIERPIAQQLDLNQSDLNHTPAELHQMGIDFKKLFKSKENFVWDEIFKPSVARQLNLCYTSKALCRMNIDHEKLLQVELIIALRQRKFTPKEKSQLFKVIYALDRSPEQCLLNTIYYASLTPKASFQKTKSIIEEKDVNINSKYKGFSFLVLAAYHNKKPEIIRFLLDKGADIEMTDDVHGQTPLYSAVFGDNIEVIKLLFDQKAKVNSRNKNGQIPLHAIQPDSIEIAKLLIARGADVNARDEDGWTPLPAIVFRGDIPCNIEIAKLLIGRGADVNARSKNGWTPLHAIVCCKQIPCNIEIVKLLINRGADVNARDENDWTPLHAMHPDNIEIAKLLIDRGANVNARDKDDWTPLHAIVYCKQTPCNIEIVKLLINRGADVNARNKDGQTPLHRILSHAWTTFRNIEVVRLLIDRGADVNAKDEYGQTPLHLALLHYGFFDIARLLIDHGADRSIRDDKGKTPFDIAMEVRTQIDDETEQREFDKALNKLNLRIA